MAAHPHANPKRSAACFPNRTRHPHLHPHAVRLLLDELQRTEAGTGKQLPAAVASAGAAGGGGAGPSVLSAEQAEVVMAGLSLGLQVVSESLT